MLKIYLFFFSFFMPGGPYVWCLFPVSLAEVISEIYCSSEQDTNLPQVYLPYQCWYQFMVLPKEGHICVKCFVKGYYLYDLVNDQMPSDYIFKSNSLSTGPHRSLSIWYFNLHERYCNVASLHPGHLKIIFFIWELASLSTLYRSYHDG